MLEHIQRRLISRQHRVDYLVFALWGLMPIMAAVVFNAYQDQSVTTQNGEFVFLGLRSRPNWLHYWLTLPLSLFLLRWSTKSLFPIGQKPDEESKIAFIGLFPKDEELDANKRLQELGEDVKTLGVVLIIVLIIHVLDMWELWYELC